jgi:hypothetical protein
MRFDVSASLRCLAASTWACRVVHGVDEIAPNEPIQTSTGTADIQFNGFLLTSLADLLIQSKSTLSQRLFYWHVNEFSIPQREIEIHVTNTHIIPANDSIKRQLSKVRPRKIVSIKGRLVEAKLADG